MTQSLSQLGVGKAGKLGALFLLLRKKRQGKQDSYQRTIFKMYLYLLKEFVS